MEHRLTHYQIALSSLRRRGELFYPSGGKTIKHNQIFLDARHTIRQGPRDTKRRGLSNREGSSNRRFRKWENSQKNSFTYCPFETATQVMADFKA